MGVSAGGWGQLRAAIVIVSRRGSGTGQVWSPVNGWIVLSPAPGDLVTRTQVSIYKGYNRCQWGHCQNSSVSDGYKIQDNGEMRSRMEGPGDDSEIS